MKKNIAALMLAGVMIAACATGCGDKPSSTVVVEDGNTNGDVSEKVVIKPGVEYTANLGENFTYEEAKLDIKFVEVAKTAKAADTQGRYSYALVFSAKNNGDEAVDINMIDDFTVTVDGTAYRGEELFSALSAANGAVRYTDYVRYDSEIAAGEEKTGFVPFAIAEESWDEMVITYKPYSDYSNDYITYTVKSAEVVNRTSKDASENDESPVESAAQDEEANAAEDEDTAEEQELSEDIEDAEDADSDDEDTEE